MADYDPLAGPSTGIGRPMPSPTLCFTEDGPRHPFGPTTHVPTKGVCLVLDVPTICEALEEGVPVSHVLLFARGRGSPRRPPAINVVLLRTRYGDRPRLQAVDAKIYLWAISMLPRP